MRNVLNSAFIRIHAMGVVSVESYFHRKIYERDLFGE